MSGVDFAIRNTVAEFENAVCEESFLLSDEEKLEYYRQLTAYLERVVPYYTTIANNYLRA
jgi:hypothetical protein